MALCQRTLALLKPDLVGVGRIGLVLARLEAHAFSIRNMMMTRMDRETAEAFYAEHKGKPFFEGNIEFMTSGPCVAVVFERHGAIRALRKLIGATDPRKADPHSIRGMYGTELPRNAIHASDSEKSAAREISIIFGKCPIGKAI